MRMADDDNNATTKRDGGPAFPVSRADFKQDGTMQSSAWITGMTLRDWFAGHALTGYLAAMPHDFPNAEVMARDCYAYADAMIAERRN